MRRNLIFATIVTALLGGCSLQTVTPPVTDYRMTAPEVRPVSDAQGCKEQTLRVSLTLAPDLFKSRQLLYADDAYVQYVYTRSRWAESPDRQLRHLFESTLAQSGLFQSVITYDSQAHNDLLFEPKLNNFMQYFDASGKAYVAMDMELVLMDQDSNRVISNRHIHKTVPTESADAFGAVRAFNAMVHETLHETTGWLHDVCQQQPLPEKR